MSETDYITSSVAINDELQSQSNETLQTLSLGGLVNATTLTMLNNTANQYASQTLANSAMVQVCNRILSS
ncbi:hypothetical protein [Rheinheimera sp.]|uniref:hypothetical protein n=1 Tax=Rheinheimera sp. TaxID=1869214 RepID=UPI00307F403A